MYLNLHWSSVLQMVIYMFQSQCSGTTLRDRVGWVVGGEFRLGRTHVYLWPIHVDVWQKPSQYCKVVILQLK